MDLDLERRDSLKETEFRVKFSAFKTPPGSSVRIPQQVYAVFKLFKSKAVQSDTLTLHKTDHSAYEASKQYYLVRGQLDPTARIDQVLDCAYEDCQLIDEAEHSLFVSYLDQKPLTITLWNAETQTVYAVGDLALQKTLRQG